jgi:hypothetical protein
VTGRPASGRLLASFLTDLIASVVIVLMLGWLVQASAGDVYLRNAMVAQDDIYVSISRFTPHNLAMSYVSTVVQMNRGVGFGYQPSEGYTDVIQYGLVTVAVVILNVFRAVPDTILELHHETGGTAAWIVLGGFAVGVGSVSVALLSMRSSPWRLVLAILASPFAISLVFLALQGFMIAMMDTFYWFTSLAPYTVACPVICTLYWVAFPNAERGATATLAHAMLRVLDRKR